MCSYINSHVLVSACQITLFNIRAQHAALLCSSLSLVPPDTLLALRSSCTLLLPWVSARMLLCLVTKISWNPNESGADTDEQSPLSYLKPQPRTGLNRLCRSPQAFPSRTDHTIRRRISHLLPRQRLLHRLSHHPEAVPPRRQSALQTLPWRIQNCGVWSISSLQPHTINPTVETGRRHTCVNLNDEHCGALQPQQCCTCYQHRILSNYFQ